MYVIKRVINLRRSVFLQIYLELYIIKIQGQNLKVLIIFICKRKFAFDLETLSTNLKRNENFYEVIRQQCFSHPIYEKSKKEKQSQNLGTSLTSHWGRQMQMIELIFNPSLKFSKETKQGYNQSSHVNQKGGNQLPRSLYFRFFFKVYSSLKCMKMNIQYIYPLYLKKKKPRISSGMQLTTVSAEIVVHCDAIFFYSLVTNVNGRLKLIKENKIDIAQRSCCINKNY